MIHISVRTNDVITAFTIICLKYIGAHDDIVRAELFSLFTKSLLCLPRVATRHGCACERNENCNMDEGGTVGRNDA